MFFSFILIISLTPSNNKPESSRDLTILTMSFISSFDIISVVLLHPILRLFLCIPASAADATVVNPKGIKKLLPNGLITFFISGNPLFSNDQEVYREILLILSS